MLYQILGTLSIFLGGAVGLILFSKHHTIKKVEELEKLLKDKSDISDNERELLGKIREYLSNPMEYKENVDDDVKKSN